MSGALNNPAVEFLCQGCGTCCRWPGDVQLTGGEVTAIARHLGLAVHDFTAAYTRLLRNRQGLSLVDHPDGSCIFLRGNRCAIQPVKPAQCREFPAGWNIPGWRDLCRAVPVPAPEPSPSSGRSGS